MPLWKKIPLGVFVWKADLCKNLIRFLRFFWHKSTLCLVQGYGFHVRRIEL